MNLQKKNCSVVILAAGNSGRMGEAKSFLKWNENTTFIQKIIDEYKNLVVKILLQILITRF